VPISRGRLALIIKNLKVYFLALPKVGLPDRREMNKNVTPPESVFMNP
jgi:hypothetical protein